MDKQFFAGKDVLVMGLGRFGGGVDAVKFAAEAGAKVVVTDLASAGQLSNSVKQLEEFSDIEYHLGLHDPADFEQADVIIVNPAVPPDNQYLQLARQHRKLIISQIGIFFQLCPATIIGITGTNGKSTTAALTAHLLRGTRDERKQRTEDRGQKTEEGRGMMNEGRETNYRNIWLSGNIGNEPLLTITDQIKPSDLVVLELSSFQIEQLAQIQKAPHIALLTNLTPNHLDRYGAFADYCAAKENIFKFQNLSKNSPAVSVFNAEDETATEWFEKYKQDAGRICIKFSVDDVSKEIRDNFPLPGQANLSNLAAALCIVRHFGIEDYRIIKCLPKFKALPHRLEFVAEKNGVEWYNDSKATTAQSAITAIEAFDRPVIIITGGYDKNIPFDEFGQKIARKAKAAILLGQTAPKIADAIKRGVREDGRGTNIKIVGSLTEAVELAKQLAVKDDVVLLSPACASYDMFDNYEHRGKEFCRLVRKTIS
jgi:UDP-N-acetylmuramoylalanine--D-glutamate ligase